ncbi:hypothetical protein GCM10027432_17730 [Lysobacter fragariae]
MQAPATPRQPPETGAMPASGLNNQVTLEIDATAVLFPIAVTRRLRALASTPFPWGLLFRHSIRFGRLPCLDRFASDRCVGDAAARGFRWGLTYHHSLKA